MKPLRPNSLRSRLRRWARPMAVISLLALAYFFWPRQGELKTFDPAGMAELEASMWHDYYAYRPVSLGVGLYRIGRQQFKVSPWDSVRLAWYAGRAAMIFKDSHNRQESGEALPFLEEYYGLVKRRSQPALEVKKSAQLELEWWQVRREEATVAQVSTLIAQLYGELFQVRNADVEIAARLRVEAMKYRDECGFRELTPVEWATVHGKLVDSYRHLSRGVNAPARDVAQSGAGR